MPARGTPLERIRAQIDRLLTIDRDLAMSWKPSPGLACACSCRLRWKRKSPNSSAGTATPAAKVPEPATATVTPSLTLRPRRTHHLARPKLRSTSQPFASRLLGKDVARSKALESLVITRLVRACRSAMSTPRWPRAWDTNNAVEVDRQPGRPGDQEEFAAWRPGSW